MFYKAAGIVNDAASAHIKRYAAGAGDGLGRKNPARQRSSSDSLNCEWIGVNPPRTFWEALQLLHFANAMI